MPTLKKLQITASAILLTCALAGCGTLLPSQDASPQEKLDAARTTASLIEAGYSAICDATPAPSFCTDPKVVAEHAAAVASVNTAFDAAQTAINASGGTLDEATTTKLFTDIADDITKFEAVLDDVKAKKATTP